MALLASDYYALLKNIQNKRPKTASFHALPYNSDTFYIDLEKREIKVPSSYSDYFSIATDHRAEKLCFAVDRYYEDVDLKNTTIVIEYINALGESRIYPVTVFDFSDPDYIKFVWFIGGEATKAAGILQFAVRFYTVDEETHRFTYNLTTAPKEGLIEPSLSEPKQGQYDNPEENGWTGEWFEYPSSAIEEVYSRLESIAKEKEVYWVDIT